MLKKARSGPSQYTISQSPNLAVLVGSPSFSTTSARVNPDRVSRHEPVGHTQPHAGFGLLIVLPRDRIERPPRKQVPADRDRDHC
jgi:hypothetical protein